MSLYKRGRFALSCLPGWVFATPVMVIPRKHMPACASNNGLGILLVNLYKPVGQAIWRVMA